MKPLRQAFSSRNIVQTWERYSYQVQRAVTTPFVKVHPAPVLVLGNQKSGTTAIAHLLARQAGCGITLDIPALASMQSLELVTGRLPLVEVIRRNRFDFSRPLIKEPWLTFAWDELVQRFPQSSVLFIVRDPRQNIRSILNRLGMPGHLDALPKDTLRAMKPGWQAVFLWEREERGEGVQYIDALAHRWNRAVEAWQRHEGKALLLRYEDFVADKAGTLQAVAKQLGLPVRHDVSLRVNRQYQPRGDRQVSPGEFFGTRNLERLERICQPHLARFGYD